MAHRVITLPQAEADAVEYAEYIAQDSREAAYKWLVGLEEAIESLSDMPERCAVIPEHGMFTRIFRHLHYHSHRIVFFIEEVVVVARIYHGARDELRPDDLSGGQ